MNLLNSRNRINQLLSLFVTQVKGATEMTMTDINHVAEAVLISLLREIYGFKDLKNLNSEQRKNYPGIDLGDEKARVAIQITSTPDSEKIKDTLKQFVKYKLYQTYDRLIVYIITEKQNSYSGNGFAEIIQNHFKFDKDKDILDYRNILAEVDKFQLDQVRAVEQILEENFGSVHPLPQIYEDVLTIQSEQRQIAQNADQERIAQTETLVIAQQDITHQQTQELGSMIEAMLRHELSEAAIQKSVISTEETAYSAKLDIARGLLKDGQTSVARKVILELREQTANQTTSTDILFRIATQLGACAHELGDIETAVAELKTALAYKPDDLLALTNAAAAASLVGDIEESLRLSVKVRHLEKKSSVATSIYLGVLYRQGKHEEIERIIADEPWITSDAMCLIALGDFRFQDGEYEKAEQYFRDATKADDKNPLPYLLLAQSILLPLQQLIHEDPPLPNKQEGPISARRGQAVEALSTVVALTEERDNSDMRNLALANRAGVLAALGQLDEAEQDCDIVLAKDKHQDTALRNKGQILLRRGDRERAAHFLEQIQGEEEKKNAALPLSSAYRYLGRFTQVIEVLQPLWETPSNEHDKIFIADALMDAYSRIGETDKAAQIEADLLKEWPDDPDTLSVLSSRRMKEGDQEQAVALLEKGLAQAQGYVRDWIRLQLAQLYYKINNFSKAAETYRFIVDTTKDSGELREFIYSLYRTEQFQEALEIARSLRGSGLPIPMISEIEAAILEQVSDWNGAATILSQLRQIEPKNLPLAMRTLLIEIKRGNHDAAKDVAQQVTYEAIKDNSELLMRMAFARNKLGMPEVLRFAYQARRIARGSADIHGDYMKIFPELNAIETEAISIGPSVMDVDCSVRLIRNGKTLAFTLIDEETAHEADGEINLSHPYAAKLRGLRVGDKVILQDNPFGAISYDVLEILSKYVFAFQEGIRRLETGQLHDPSMFVGDITDPDFMPNFMAGLDQLRERGESIRAAYEENKIPLCVMANWLKRSEFEVWSTLISSRGGRVNAATRDPQEWLNQKAVLAVTNTLVLETSALFTIQHLGLGVEVSQAFSRLLVAQSTLDALSRYLDESLASRPHHSIWSEGDHYVHQEVSVEQIAKQKKFVRDIVEFIQNFTEVLPAVDLITMNPKFMEALGEPTAGAMALSFGQGVPLYSDDLVLRIVAYNEEKIAGVWTQAILEHLWHQDILSSDQYYSAVEKLVIGNYFIVSVDVGLFQWILERDALKTTPEVIRVFETLVAPYTDDNEAVSIVAQIAKWLWIQQSLLQTRLFVLSAMLMSLVNGRNGFITLKTLKYELGKIMSLLPLQRREICASIDAWAATKLL